MIACKNSLCLHFDSSRVPVTFPLLPAHELTWDPPATYEGSKKLWFSRGKKSGSRFFLFKRIFGSSANLPTSPTPRNQPCIPRGVVWGVAAFGGHAMSVFLPWGSAASLTYIRVSRDPSTNSNASRWLIVSMCNHTSGW